MHNTWMREKIGLEGRIKYQEKKIGSHFLCYTYFAETLYCCSKLTDARDPEWANSFEVVAIPAVSPFLQQREIKGWRVKMKPRWCFYQTREIIACVGKRIKSWICFSLGFFFMKWTFGQMPNDSDVIHFFFWCFSFWCGFPNLFPTQSIPP